jgi:hypothetical protein
MPENIIPPKYGLLTVIEDLGVVRLYNKTQRLWLVRCDCGTVKKVRANRVKAGDIVSCGCVHRKVMAIGPGVVTHGGAHRGRIEPEYQVFVSMIQRCYDENQTSFKNYGGRGIKVCDEWRNDYAAFRAYVGPKPTPKHSIDRFPDNNGNYEPGNVRWATADEQGRNRRNNRFFTFEGETLCYADWPARLGIGRGAFYYRISKAPIEEVIGAILRDRPLGDS